jgi:hypothetical protein
VKAVEEFADEEFFAQLWPGPEGTKSEKSSRR